MLIQGIIKKNESYLPQTIAINSVFISLHICPCRFAFVTVYLSFLIFLECNEKFLSPYCVSALLE